MQNRKEKQLRVVGEDEGGEDRGEVGGRKQERRGEEETLR